LTIELITKVCLKTAGQGQHSKQYESNSTQKHTIDTYQSNTQCLGSVDLLRYSGASLYAKDPLTPKLYFTLMDYNNRGK